MAGDRRSDSGTADENHVAVEGQKKSRYEAGEDPYVRQAMARMEEGGTSADFVSILEGLPDKKAARCNAAVIEAVMEFVDSKSKRIRYAAEHCVMGLMKKNSEELAKAMVEICSDRGSQRQRVVCLRALGLLGEAVPDLSPDVEAHKERYRVLVEASPAKRKRIAEIKQRQAQIKRMRAEQGLDDEDEEGKGKSRRGGALRDKLKGRQQSEGAQLEVELEELEKQMLSLDSGSFLAEIADQEKAWSKLRERRIAFNAILIDTLLQYAADSDGEVVKAALGSMGSLTSRGNMTILNAITRLLSNPNNADAVSIALMGQTAPVGHEEALSIAIKYLATSGTTGDAALEALGKIAVRNDGKSLEAVLLHMEEGDLPTKARASSAVPMVADIGDEVALGKVRRLVTHQSRDVRLVAVRTLVLLCQHGDEQTIPALRMSLQGDSDELVRSCALAALCKCAHPNDKRTLTTMANAVSDGSKYIRHQAGLALGAFIHLLRRQADANNDEIVAEAAGAAAEAKAAAEKASSGAPGTKRAMEKAAADAGAAAAATAQIERHQYREVVVSQVATILMEHTRSPDRAVSSAAFRALGIIACSRLSGTNGEVLGPKLLQSFHASCRQREAAKGEGDLNKDDAAYYNMLFECLVLMCGPDEVFLLLQEDMVSHDMRQCLQALNEMSNDLHRQSAEGASNPANAAAAKRKNSFEKVFCCASLDEIQNMMEVHLIPRLQAIGDAPLQATTIAKEKEEARARENGRCWMALLAIRRCEIEALGLHLESAPSQVHQIMDSPEHVMFRGAVGRRLKSALVPALLKVLGQPSAIISSLAADVLLDLCPGGHCEVEGGENEGSTADDGTLTVVGMITSRIVTIMDSHDSLEARQREDLAQQQKERKETTRKIQQQRAKSFVQNKGLVQTQQAEPGKSAMDIAQETTLIQKYLKLLGNLGEISRCARCIGGSTSSQSATANPVLLDVLERLVCQRKTLQYCSKKTCLLAVRAQGFFVPSQPSLERISAALDLLEGEPEDAHSAVVVLVAIARMEHTHMSASNLKLIVDQLAHQQTIVQKLAAQVLHFQLTCISDDSRAVLAGALLQLLDGIANGGKDKEYISAVRGAVLRLFACWQGIQPIQLSSAITHAVTQCLYDFDVIVQTQALEVLEHLTSPLLFSPSVRSTPQALSVSPRADSRGMPSAMEEEPRDPRYVLVEGQPTRLSALLMEPPAESNSAAMTLQWIHALESMGSFDEGSMTAVTQKLSMSLHWSVRRAAVAYLLRGLRVSPPPLPMPEEDDENAAPEARTSSSTAETPSGVDSVLVGMQNERKAAREALKYLRSDVAGVRNAAAQLLKAMLPAENGAREVILQGNTLADLLSHPRTKQLCFTAFAGDSELLERCRQADAKSDSDPLGAAERRCSTASVMHESLSQALDNLLACSQDPDISVRRAAIKTWSTQDFTACNKGARDAAVARLTKHASDPRRAGVWSREMALQALSAIVVRGNAVVTRVLLDLLEDEAAQVRMAAAEALLELASATQDVVSHLIGLVDKPERYWRRRDNAVMEIKAAAFWILSKIEPQFSNIPSSARIGGNHRVIDFLWGKASFETKLARQRELDIWVRETLAAGDSLLVKVRRAISEGRWEDARHDANQAMEEYLIAKAKGSHPEITIRILDMDQVFFDIANFIGRTWEKSIDAQIRQIDRCWVPDIHAVDRQGWTRLHYLSRWNMPDAIEEMVAAGLDINAVVLSGAYRGRTPYDLAYTDSLRSFILGLGGYPSRSSVPEYSIERPVIPKPMTGIRMRTDYNDQPTAEPTQDSRRSFPSGHVLGSCSYDVRASWLPPCKTSHSVVPVRSKVSMKDASILDAAPPSVWTPDKENGRKLTASTRIAQSLCSLTPVAHHSIHFLSTLSDGDD